MKENNQKLKQKKTKLNKAKNINKEKKMQNQIKSTKLLNEIYKKKNYLILLRWHMTPHAPSFKTYTWQDGGSTSLQQVSSNARQRMPNHNKQQQQHKGGWSKYLGKTWNDKITMQGKEQQTTTSNNIKARAMHHNKQQLSPMPMPWGSFIWMFIHDL